MTALGAVAAVINDARRLHSEPALTAQANCKSSTASLHTQNAVLYAFGFEINLLVYILRATVTASEPAFFAGFGSLSAVGLILLQALLGIVITYVYRCARRSDR